jgi:cupin fold WbuC family metalloprotein
MPNSIQPGSYIRPNRHLDPPKDEGFALLKGSAGFVIFDAEQGLGKKEFSLLDFERGTYGIDIRAGVWHTLFSLQPDTVLYEVKPGPFTPLTDKDFAPWSPRDNSPEGWAHRSLVQIQLRVALIAFYSAPEDFVAAFRTGIAGFFILNPFFSANLSPIGNSPQNDLLAHSHRKTFNMLAGKFVALMTPGVTFLYCARPDLTLSTVHKLVIR